MAENFNTINETYQGNIEEKKSKFISCLIPVTSEDEAKAQIAVIRKKYHDANHHCFAYVIHEKQILERYGDDGEPAGTAGMPMLEVLRGKALENALAIVVRYFGGTKLGTGGLVRAYTKATQEALNVAAIIRKGLYQSFSVEIPYTLSGKMDYFIQKEGLLLVDTNYSEDVIYDFCCLTETYEAIVEKLVEQTNGALKIIKKDAQIGYVQEGKFIIDK